MDFKETRLPGAIIIEPKVYEDERGYFFESFKQIEFEKNIGKIKFFQENESKSSYGVLRGLHYQKPPFTQAKLVRVIKGKVLDVAVDIRRYSKTFGQHVIIELTEYNRKQLFIPEGFAHGFISLSNETIFSYKCTYYYNKESEASIIYNDQHLNIDWKIRKENILVSEKDKLNSRFKDAFYF